MANLSTMGRIRYLDGWRGAAMLFVLLGHFGPLGSLWGTFGVELFFVLSGRLMAHILYEKRMPMPLFFWRRFSRIYPALFAYVAAMLALTLAAHLAGYREGTDALSAISALTFTINYYAALGGHIEGPLDHLWSIAIEEHCYAILALIALLIQRRTDLAIVICFAFGGVAMLNGVYLFSQGVGYVHEIYWRTDVRLAPVFISAGMYLLSRKASPPPAWIPVVLALGSIPVFAILEPLPLKMIVPSLMLAYAVNTIDFAPEQVRAILSARWLTSVGLVSYSLYLWQQPFYKLTHGAPWAIIPATILAALSYFLIENPARRRLNGKRSHELEMQPVL